LKEYILSFSGLLASSQNPSGCRRSFDHFKMVDVHTSEVDAKLALSTWDHNILMLTDLQIMKHI